MLHGRRASLVSYDALQSVKLCSTFDCHAKGGDVDLLTRFVIRFAHLITSHGYANFKLEGTPEAPGEIIIQLKILPSNLIASTAECEKDCTVVTR